MVISAGIDALLFGLVGLLFGSFLNVVVYRLPVMMQSKWETECAELMGQPAPNKDVFNLLIPRSRCRQCGHTLSWFENIPLLSFLLQRGRCRHCQAHFGFRYPAVELVTGLLFFLCAWRFGTLSTAMLWCGFSATLLTLGLIDWDTTLLPDDLTLPLLWAGLIAAQMGWTHVALSDALWGTVAGYLSLWIVYWAFKLVTGKEGMGFGDFKLFAALGAWFGWHALIPIILMASVLGAVVGISLKTIDGLREGGYVPFGPFLAGAGLTAMLVGPKAVLEVLGL